MHTQKSQESQFVLAGEAEEQENMCRADTY